MGTILRSGLFLVGLTLGMPVMTVLAQDGKGQIAQQGLEKTSLTIMDRQGHRHEFQIELARTPKQREAGETFRTAVPEGTGMLFLSDPPEARAMWMHDTPVSLDMVFIGADGRIQAIVENTVPFSEANITGHGESAAVLEVQNGTMAKYGIVVGDRVTSKALPTVRVAR